MALKRIRDYPAASAANASDMIEAETADGQSIRLTAAQIAALGGGGGGTPDADAVSYDNTASGLTASDVQAAIDELAATPPSVPTAASTSYDNAASGLSAANVQDAIDELAAVSPGTGDVVGPSSSVDAQIAVFDGATGKLIKDGGLAVSDLYFDAIAAAAISGGTVTLNCNGGRVRNFTVSMTANATLAVSNLAPAGRITEFECLIAQDATGARTLTLPAAFRPLGGSDTAIAAAAGAKTVLSAKTFDAGTTWLYAMQEVG